jgi:hypothetical protein
MARHRRHSASRPTPAFPGEHARVRAVAAALIAEWDGWQAGPDYRPRLADPVRPQIESLRAALADPDPDQFTTAVAALLAGVPMPSAAQAVRATTEQLRRTAYPPTDHSPHPPPFG